MQKHDVLAAALVIIGALNWGLAGAFHLDLIFFRLQFDLKENVLYCKEYPEADFPERKNSTGNRYRKENDFRHGV